MACQRMLDVAQEMFSTSLFLTHRSVQRAHYKTNDNAYLEAQGNRWNKWSLIEPDEDHDWINQGDKKFRIDGIEERVRGYGWHCDGNELKGHYVNTTNYKLIYDMEGKFVCKEKISHLVSI